MPGMFPSPGGMHPPPGGMYPQPGGMHPPPGMPPKEPPQFFKHIEGMTEFHECMMECHEERHKEAMKEHEKKEKSTAAKPPAGTGGAHPAAKVPPGPPQFKPQYPFPQPANAQLGGFHQPPPFHGGPTPFDGMGPPPGPPNDPMHECLQEAK